MSRENLVAICLSGGLDSTTLLADLWNHMSEEESEDWVVNAFTFKYPSKHNELERTAAHDVALYYNIPLHTLDVTSIYENMKGSALLTNNDKAIPEGHYEEETMKATVVPLRNIIFVSVAAAAALELYDNKPFTLGLGVHAGDHAIYPDCRAETISSLNYTLLLGSDGNVQLTAPFISMTKAQIVGKGIELFAPYELTRTCYTSNKVACGKCGSCIERLEAFALIDAIDPIPYAV